MTLSSRIRRILKTIWKTSGVSTSTGERSSPRFPTPIYARFDGRGPLVERRGNVGVGGFCFEAERDYPAGCQVELFFRLPGLDHWVQVQGEVLGRAEYSGWIGIRGRFLDLAFEDERLLARWLDRQAFEVQFQAAS